LSKEREYTKLFTQPNKIRIIGGKQYSGLLYINLVSSTPMKNARYLICQLNPIAFRAVDMFPQTIKIRVS
jgi:hypothetical protein